MTCRELADFLADYLAGALPAATRVRFEEHLAECEDCVAYLESYRATIELARDACGDDDQRPADLPESLLRAILAARRS
jgi:predicted anti-sigma-YlaC factor YlaD